MIHTDPSQVKDPMISLCICSYNRAESLRRALNTVEAQEGYRNPFEILLIDNNSSDHTRDVAHSFSGRLPIRYFFERTQGLSHARNRALKEFRGRFLLFTDDDIRLPPDWLETFETAIQAHPDADYFGGRVLPDWNGEKPGWIGERPLPLIDGLLGWFDLGDETRHFRDDDIGPVGASFAFSRRLADEVGAFGAGLGCNGRERGRGEETDWISRARLLGARGVYIGAATCWHRVDAASLTLPRLFVYGVHSGRAIRIMRGGSSASTVYRIGSFALRGLWQLLRGRGDRFRQCIINAGIVWGEAMAARGRSNDSRAAAASQARQGE